MMKKKITVILPRDLELTYGDAAKLDEKDKKLLSMLSIHGRMSVADLAKEINMSRDATKYRVDRLLHEHVIQGFTAVVNPAKVGLPMYCAILISLWNLSLEREKQLIAYVKEAPYIIYCAKVMGKWDLWIEVFARDNGHLDEIVAELRQKFSDIIKDIEINPVIKEHKWKEFPGRL